jgi:hypothetical protein
MDSNRFTAASAVRQSWRSGDEPEALRIIASENDLDLSKPQDKMKAAELVVKKDPNVLGPRQARLIKRKQREDAALEAARQQSDLEERQEEIRLAEEKRQLEHNAQIARYLYEEALMDEMAAMKLSRPSVNEYDPNKLAAWNECMQRVRTKILPR